MIPLYRGLDRAALDREYSPSLAAGGDITPYLRRYAALSEIATRLPGFRPGIPYGEHPDEVFDLFVPAGPGPWPVHVFIHGGYWQAMNQRDFAFIAPAFLKRGVAFASLNYTIAPAASIGDMIDQCRRAIARIAADAGRLGIDPGRITLSGHSAGAHLAAMTLSEIVERALLISGIYDLEPIRLSYVDAPLRLTPADVAAWSPLGLDLPARCPVAVAWGEHDTAEFRRQSRSFAERLAESGRAVSSAEFTGLNHFDILFEFLEDDSRLIGLALGPTGSAAFR
jgi:arylformamidase